MIYRLLTSEWFGLALSLSIVVLSILSIVTEKSYFVGAVCFALGCRHLVKDAKKLLDK